VQTDASTTGLGAVLTQHFEEGERVIASRTLNGAEKNYSATELECLAVVWGIRHFRGYLEGYQFSVITDHQALRWLREIESPTGRLARWMLELQQYTFDVKYRRGKLNRVADALSRLPAVQAAREPVARGTTNSSVECANAPTSSPTTPCGRESYTDIYCIQPISARCPPNYSGRSASRNINAPGYCNACMTNPRPVTWGSPRQ